MAKTQKYSFNRVETHMINNGHDNYQSIGVLCQKSRRIKNRTNYLIKNEKLTHSQVDKQLKKNEQTLYKKLPAAVSQRCTQIVGKEWKGFYESKKAYEKKPSHFNGKPKPPKYYHHASTIYIPRSSFKVINNKMFFAKELNLLPMKVMHSKSQNFNHSAESAIIKEVRFVPLGRSYKFEIIYDTSKTKHYIKQHTLLDKNRCIAIDIGLNNLAAIISNEPSVAPVLISGKPLKSINALYNKQVANLKTKRKSDSKQKYKSRKNHVLSKSRKRYNQINDYLHKASRFIVNHCLKNDIGTIIIGKNKEWKQESNMGKRNNQNFVSIPHYTFINKIRYKAQEYGINVIEREESYTSKASSIDLDPLPVYGDKKEKITFSGRRIKRGLYKSKSGFLLNSDINGALNIGRKELGDDFVSRYLSDRGCVNQPILKTMVNVNFPKVFGIKRIPLRSQNVLKDIELNSVIKTEANSKQQFVA